MSQSRLHSMFESLFNVAVGFGINMVLNFTVFPQFGWHITLKQNLMLGVVYTVVSIARSYVLRRLFNRIHQVAPGKHDIDYGVGV